METFSEAIIAQLRADGYKIQQDGINNYIYFINSKPYNIYPDLRGFLLTFNDDAVDIIPLTVTAETIHLGFDITNPKFNPIGFIKCIEKLLDGEGPGRIAYEE